MIEIEEDDVIVGDTYFVVCDDGVLRYLTAERDCCLNTLTEYVYYNVHGGEEYRTYSPHKLFKL